MSKHHHQSKAEQINNKARGAAPLEKGVSGLDNWLEEEQSLNDNHKTVLNFLNEGNSNTHKNKYRSIFSAR